MPANGDDLRVNGYVIGWGSHILKINGLRWFGITSFDWGQKRERVHAHGMSKAHAPIGLTSGKYSPEPFKLSMWKKTEIKLRKYLATLAEDGRSYGNVLVPIFLQIVDGPDVSTVELVDSGITSEAATGEESPDPTKATWEFLPTLIVVDGLTLFDNTTP